MTIRDTKAAPGYVQGKTFYDGSLTRFNTTPGEESFEFLHKSGSSIKFDADGNISIIAKKDLKLVARNGDSSHIKVNGNLDIDVSKDLKIKCAQYDLDGGKAIRESAKVVSTKAEKEYVVKGESITIDAANTIHVESNSLNTVTNAQDHEVKGIFVMVAEHGVAVEQKNEKGGIEFTNAGFWTNDVGMSMYTTVNGTETNFKTPNGFHYISAGQIFKVTASKIYLN